MSRAHMALAAAPRSRFAASFDAAAVLAIAGMTVEAIVAPAAALGGGRLLQSVPRDSHRVLGSSCYFCATHIGAISRPVALVAQCSEGRHMSHFLRKTWQDEEGQDMAEYSVMLAVILVIVMGTVRLIGSNANNAFSQVGSAIQ